MRKIVPSTFSSAAPVSPLKTHFAPVGRLRIHTASPLWATSRAEREPAPVRTLREPIPLQPVPEPELRFDELDLALDADGRALWCYMKPKARPSFTRSLLGELIALRRALQTHYATPHRESVVPRYFVGGSRLPRIYNLGGDLAYFAEKIRSRDREALLQYALDCVDVGYHMSVGFNLPIITIALVQGDALGGGFEGALSFNVIVAEKGARFGLPEVLFNLFPGMGAYNFLARKLNTSQAERIILSGEIYSAAELHAMGLVDVLAEDGEGEAAVRDYIARHARHQAVHRSIRNVRDRVWPLTLQELRDCAEIWVDHALQLDEADLRKMERLRAAQNRRIARV